MSLTGYKLCFCPPVCVWILTKTQKWNCWWLLMMYSEATRCAECSLLCITTVSFCVMSFGLSNVISSGKPNAIVLHCDVLLGYTITAGSTTLQRFPHLSFRPCLYKTTAGSDQKAKNSQSSLRPPQGKIKTKTLLLILYTNNNKIKNGMLSWDFYTYTVGGSLSWRAPCCAAMFLTADKPLFSPKCNTAPL